MPSATAETREAIIERYVYLRALGNVIYTLAVGHGQVRVPIDTCGREIVPLDGLPGEPDDCDELQIYLDRLCAEEAELLWGSVEDDEPEYSDVWRRADMLTGWMLCRIAGASAFCAQHAEGFRARATDAEAGDA